MTRIEQLLRELPPESQTEVEDFVLFLRTKQVRTTPGRKLRQDWAGVLKDYRGQYTSLDLQKKALEWRGD